MPKVAEMLKQAQQGDVEIFLGFNINALDGLKLITNCENGPALFKKLFNFKKAFAETSQGKISVYLNSPKKNESNLTIFNGPVGKNSFQRSGLEAMSGQDWNFFGAPFSARETTTFDIYDPKDLASFRPYITLINAAKADLMKEINSGKAPSFQISVDLVDGTVSRLPLQDISEQKKKFAHHIVGHAFEDNTQANVAYRSQIMANLAAQYMMSYMLAFGTLTDMKEFMFNVAAAVNDRFEKLPYSKDNQ